MVPSCIGLCRNQSKLPLIYDSCADFSEVLHIATSFWRNFQTPVKTSQESSKIVDLIGRAPLGANFNLLYVNQYALSAETWRISVEPMREGRSDVASGRLTDGGWARRHMRPYVAYGVRSESVGGVWCPFAYFCVGRCPNYCWYMTVVQNFQKCFILLPSFDEPVWSFQKFAGCVGNWSFRGESSYPPRAWQIL